MFFNLSTIYGVKNFKIVKKIFSNGSKMKKNML